MAAIKVSETFFTQTLNTVANGSVMQPVFAAAGIKNNALLLGMKPSFGSGVISDKHLQALHVLLEGVKITGHPGWPSDAGKGMRYLGAMIMTARSLAMPEAAAIAAVLIPVAGSVTGAGSAAVVAPPAPTAASLAKEGMKLYETAGEIYGSTGHIYMNLEAEYRVKYEIIGKLAAGYKARTPVAIPLGDFALELSVTTSKEESYSAFGQTWVSKDAADKTTRINDDFDLKRMMARRAQGTTVAGSWDVDALAASSGGVLTYVKSARSKLSYIAGTSIKTMDCYATAAVQFSELQQMEIFRQRHPHVPISKVVSIIDTGIQRKKVPRCSAASIATHANRSCMCMCMCMCICKHMSADSCL